MIRDHPSRSEFIRPGLAVRVNPVRLLYLPFLKFLFRILTLSCIFLFEIFALHSFWLLISALQFIPLLPFVYVEDICLKG